MTAPATSHLRPLNIGRLLDQAVRMYRQNFLKFIGIIAIVQVPVMLLQMIVSLFTFADLFSVLENAGPTPDPADIFGPSYFTGIGASFVIGILSFLLVQGVATAALTKAISQSYLGEGIGITESYRRIGQSWLPLIGTLLLGIILTLALVVWFIIPCIGWLTGLGMLIFFGLVIYPLIPPVVVLEKQTAMAAFRRAWDLARRRFWWVLLFVVILTIFAQLIITAPVSLITFMLQLTIGEPSSLFVTQTIVQSIAGLVFSLIYLPLQLTAITLMYFDLRIRTEGFDLDVLSATVKDEQNDLSDLFAQAPLPEKGNVITWNETGYFVLVEIAAVALYFVFIFLMLFLFTLFGIAAGF